MFLESKAWEVFISLVEEVFSSVWDSLACEVQY